MATIRKRPGKRGIRWQAIVRIGGHRTQRETFSTKAAAQNWARTTESAIVDGKRLPTREAKRRTVRDLLERYKTSEIPKKGDTDNPTRQADFWIARLGDLRLFQLSPAVVVEVRDEMHLKRSAATVNRYLALLSHACTTAVREWEWMESNPLRRVKRLKEPPGRVRYLNDGERNRLLAAVKASDYPYLNVITLIAITTGARRGEIFGLRWRDIDLTARRAVLHKTKNSERRSLTLVGPVVDELKKHRKIRSLTNDYLFTPNGGRSFEFRNAWNKALQDAEITDFRFHDLRHCCASYLAMNGATTAEIAAVLGHKTLAMVKRYSHLSDEHVRGIVERTAAKVLKNE